MEALRTQVDNLQWEVNRLEAENRSLRAQDTEASKRVDLELEVEQVTKELQSLQEVLAAKEAEFIQTSTAKEQELEETVAKLQEAEAELENVRQQQQAQSELHEGEMKQLVKQIEQLQQQLKETVRIMN